MQNDLLFLERKQNVQFYIRFLIGSNMIQQFTLEFIILQVLTREILRVARISCRSKTD